MNSMLRQNQVRYQELLPYLRGYDPSKPQPPEEWARDESALYASGSLLFCLDPVVPSQGAPGMGAFTKKDGESTDLLRVKDMCIVVGADAGKLMAVNITASAYELRYLEQLLLEKARKAILDGKEFHYVAAAKLEAPTSEITIEIVKLGSTYAAGGSRRSLVLDSSTLQEPALAFLGVLGAKLAPGLGKQVLDIGWVCHMIFAPDGRQDDKQKQTVRAVIGPIPGSNPQAALAAPLPSANPASRSSTNLTPAGFGPAENLTAVTTPASRSSTNLTPPPFAQSLIETSATLPKSAQTTGSNLTPPPFVAPTQPSSSPAATLSLNAMPPQPNPEGSLTAQAPEPPAVTGPAEGPTAFPQQAAPASTFIKETAQMQMPSPANQAQYLTPPPGAFGAQPASDIGAAGYSAQQSSQYQFNPPTTEPPQSPPSQQIEETGIYRAVSDADFQKPPSASQTRLPQAQKPRQSQTAMPAAARASQQALAAQARASQNAMNALVPPEASVPAAKPAPESAAEPATEPLSEQPQTIAEAAIQEFNTDSYIGLDTDPNFAFEPVDMAAVEEQAQVASTEPPIAEVLIAPVAAQAEAEPEQAQAQVAPAAESTQEAAAEDDGFWYNPDKKAGESGALGQAVSNIPEGNMSTALSGPPPTQAQAAAEAQAPAQGEQWASNWTPPPEAVPDSTYISSAPPPSGEAAASESVVQPAATEGTAATLFERLGQQLNKAHDDTEGQAPQPAEPNVPLTVEHQPEHFKGLAEALSGLGEPALDIQPLPTPVDDEDAIALEKEKAEIREAGLKQKQVESERAEQAKREREEKEKREQEEQQALEQAARETQAPESTEQVERISLEQKAKQKMEERLQEELRQQRAKAEEEEAQRAREEEEQKQRERQEELNRQALAKQREEEEQILKERARLANLAKEKEAEEKRALAEQEQEQRHAFQKEAFQREQEALKQKPKQPAAEAGKEPKMVMNEMTMLLSKLEQDLSKAAAKLSSRSDEIRLNLHNHLEEFLSKGTEQELVQEAKVEQMTDRLKDTLESVSEELRLKIAEVATASRNELKSLSAKDIEDLEANQSSIQDRLRNSCQDFRYDAEKLTQATQDRLDRIIDERTLELNELVEKISASLDDVSAEYTTRLKSRFEKFKERMADEKANVIRSLERNVRSMEEEIDISFERASEKLQSSQLDYENTIEHELKAAKLALSKQTRAILATDLLPSLQDHRDILATMAKDMANKFAEDSQSQIRSQIDSLERSMYSTRNQLQGLVEACLEKIEDVGRGRQLGLEELFKDTSRLIERGTHECTSGLEKTERAISENEEICRRLAESSNIDSEPELTEERNTAVNKVQQLKAQVSSELESALESKCHHLETLSERLQGDLGRTRSDDVQSIRESAEFGIRKVRDAIQEVQAAIQTMREKYME